MKAIDDSISTIASALHGLGNPSDEFNWQPTLAGLWGDEEQQKPRVYTGTSWTQAPDRQAKQSLLEIATAQIGSPYVWASSNPEGPEGGEGSAFDCSGFTQYVLGQLGIETQHMASLQQDQFRSIGREDLQPGDLVFFNYGRKAAGVADHVGLYIGNGQMVAASSSEGQVVRQPVDWEHFIGGGDTGALADAGVRPSKVAAPSALSQGLVLLRPPTSPDTNLLANVMMQMHVSEPGQPAVNSSGVHGGIKAQLVAGFRKAGRPDLAQMVRTRDFAAWVGAESGWNAYTTSQYFPGHGVNYGLFQFWEGHPWTGQYVSGGEWTATPFQQALLVARYFPNLSADDIRRYASEVRSGTYHGWP